MAATGSDEGVAFFVAYNAYRFAGTDSQRRAATNLLREEIKRQELALAATLKGDMAARKEKFLRDQARLEEQLDVDVKGLDTAAAIRQACIDLLLEKLDTDPEGASLYARAVLSWDPTMDSAWSTGWPLRDEIKDGVKETVDQWRKSKEGLEGFSGPSRRTLARLAKLERDDVRVMAADATVILTNRGYNIPASELSAALGASVRLKKDAAAKNQLWKDAAQAAVTAISVVGSVVSTLHTLKDIRQDQNEPILSCRHYLPPGWFFE